MNARFCIVAALACLSIARAGPVSFWQSGNVLMMSNTDVVLQYNLSAGTTAFYWNNSEKISAFYAGVGLNTGYVKGINFSNRIWSVVSSNEVAVVSHASGLPVMTQYFKLDQTDSFLTQVTMTGAGASANWMGPVVVDATGGVDLGITNDNRALFVPFDNDGFVSYDSESINGSDTGNEAGAFYDNVSRNGLVVGSVTHDTWKTGVYWSGSNYKLNQLNVYGGATSYWTWDVMAHGFVTGSTISSPMIFVGFGNDWRTTMEQFANENALFAPPLLWTNGVPFGWNSWGVTNYQENINYSDAIAVSDSIHTNLQRLGFTNSGSVYVNLDSYWDNLSSAQLQSFVNHCHANGQKAGVYWGPFVYWGTLAQSSNQIVPGSTYFYSDVLLRTTNGSAISTDGAYAIDPTHPGTGQLINHEINIFTNDGFDYIKLDFLSHGSREGVHYNTNITTGIEAYNQGMQYLFNQIAGRMFISESISPIFPYQYGDSRRIACDAEQSEIGNTAYTMNAVSLGWWISGRLYPFNDPDILVFDNGPNTNEVQSRLINGAITGLFLNGSILTNPASISMAQLCLTNPAINAVARVGRTFRPVDGASGTGAADIMVRQDGGIWRIAVFNYNTSSTNQTVNLASAGMPAGNYTTTNLWDGTTSVVSGSFTVSLNAKQAKLFSLAPVIAPPVVTTQPASYTNTSPMYSGVPITLTVAASGAPPMSYQWYEVARGMTNVINGAINASYTYFSQGSDSSAALGFFVVVTNNYGSITSSLASVALGTIVPGNPDALSVQFTLTNYAGYSGGVFLAPTDTAGVYGVSNWNVFAITPAGGSAGTQPGVTDTNLVDRFGILTPASITVVNVSDGWHETSQTITNSDPANARMMNTFWKTYSGSSPGTNILYATFGNVPNDLYTAYVYLLQNNAGATGNLYGGASLTNYFREFTAFTSTSNFVTAVDYTGATNPYVNYLKLAGLSTRNSNSLTITITWTSGSDGIGVCGVQLVPRVVLAPGPRTNSQFSLQFPAPNGQNYVVESSGNLSSWVPVVTNSPTNGWFMFVNTNAAGAQQFYRIKQ